MSTSTVTRVPAGVPSGGQFARGSAAESPVRLPGQVGLAEPVHGPPAYLRHEALTAAAALLDPDDRATAADLLAPHLEPRAARAALADASRRPTRARPARVRALLAQQQAAQFAAGPDQDRLARHRRASGVRYAHHLPEQARATILAGALPHLAPDERDTLTSQAAEASLRAERYDAPGPELADLAYEAGTEDLEVLDMDEHAGPDGYDFHEVGRALHEGWDARARDAAMRAVQADEDVSRAGPYGQGATR